MNMTFKIAKTELKNLFYSPVAWFLTVVFMIQCAAYYFAPIVQSARMQDMALRSMPKFKSLGGGNLTWTLLMNGDSLFLNVLINLYLFIPLLTMGLISREINNGTIKLLYSSPVKTREIVCGKYLAMLIYNLMLVAIVGIFMCLAVFQIKDADVGLLLSAALAFFLLISAYAAIGLFMSSLSTYQIVAAIGTFIITMILTKIGGLWQKHEFVRDLTYFLAMPGRTLSMLKGLITTKDVIYFSMIIFMFVSFTLIKLKSGRQSKPWFIVAGRYTAIFALVLTIGYISSRPGMIGYLDTTAGKSNTLHPKLQKLLKELGDEPLEVTLYTNLLGQGVLKGVPEGRNRYLTDLWEKYLRFKPNIVFKYANFYDIPDGDSTLKRRMPNKNVHEMAKEIASVFDQDTSLFMPPHQIRKMVDLGDEGGRVVMILRHKGNSTFLRTFNDQGFWPEEEQVAASLKRLMKQKLPKVLFLTGNQQRDIFREGEREYNLLVRDRKSRHSLLNMGFDSDTLSPGKEIPTDISALVLADPKSELDEATRQHIKTYIDKGGNMLILGEPGKQHVVNPVLKHFGAQLENGTIVELSKHESPDMVRPYITPYVNEMVDDVVSKDAIERLKEGDTVRAVTMQGTAPVAFSDSAGFKANIMIATDPNKNWLKRTVLVADSSMPVFNALEGDTKAISYPTVVTLSRKIQNKDQRIIVCGDADFLSKLRQRGGSYLFVGHALFCWFTHGEFPVFAPEEKPKDTLLTTTTEAAKTTQVIFVWVVPALLTLFAAVLLIRRKRQ